MLVNAGKLPARDAAGRTHWVTRARPKIDRIACPWLIRRFVDPEAVFLVVVPAEVPAEPSSDVERLHGLLNRSIDDCGLSVRSINSLKNSNIRSLGDLVRQTESQILQVKNFGKKSLQEIADLLEREGLNFGMRFDENGEGVRVTDWGTPPSRAAANAPDDVEEE